MSESLLIPCPHCAALNRVPADRLNDGGHCGRCKAGLFAGAPVVVITGSTRGIGRAMAEAFAAHDVRWFEEPVSSDDRHGLAEVELGGPAGLDRAEITGPRADVAQDHHRGGAAGPAFAEVRALRALADRVQPVFTDQPIFSQAFVLDRVGRLPDVAIASVGGGSTIGSTSKSST